MPRNDDTKALRIISGGQTGVDRAALDVALSGGQGDQDQQEQGGGHTALRIAPHLRG